MNILYNELYSRLPLKITDMACYSFLDDYSEGAHPDILTAITKANLQPQAPYGEDEFTKNARRLIKEKMNAPDSAVHLVPTGTLANIIAIGSCLRPHEAVIAPNSGHIALREVGAIEATGHKIISVEPVQGKLTPEGIVKAVGENSLYPHMAVPRLVYVSNATELGTIYTRAELHAIADVCKRHDLLLFLDGARLGVALAAEKNDLTLEDMGRLTDIFWIGGTKVGALLGEAIVINNPALQKAFIYHIKQRGGLLSKSRVLGLQFEELFRANLFSELASHANQMAQALSTSIQEAGYNLTEDTATNQVFAIFPDSLVAKLKDTFSFHVWEKRKDGQSIVRLVTSWATEPKQVEAFIRML